MCVLLSWIMQSLVFLFNFFKSYRRKTIGRGLNPPSPLVREGLKKPNSLVWEKMLKTYCLFYGSIVGLILDYFSKISAINTLSHKSIKFHLKNSSFSIVWRNYVTCLGFLWGKHDKSNCQSG